MYLLECESLPDGKDKILPLCISTVECVSEIREVSHFSVWHIEVARFERIPFKCRDEFPIVIWRTGCPWINNVDSGYIWIGFYDGGYIWIGGFLAGEWVFSFFRTPY